MAKSLEFVRDDARSKAAAQCDQLLGAIVGCSACRVVGNLKGGT